MDEQYGKQEGGFDRHWVVSQLTSPVGQNDLGHKALPPIEAPVDVPPVRVERLR